MKRLVLHIGFYKTGTTSIQACLSVNSAQLLSQGVFYPKDMGASYVQRRKHSPLVAALPDMKPTWLNPKKSQTYEQAYDDLFRTLGKTEFETLILSAEVFGGRKVLQKQMDWLKQRFADYEITIISYIRPQDAYLLSVYQQRVKGGFDEPFEFSMHEKMPDLRFAQRLDPWRTAFGAENVIVRPFVPALWHEGELFFDFLHALGLQYDGLKIAKVTNEGLDYRAVELVRSLNALGDRDFATKKLRNRMAANLHEFMGEDFVKKKMALSSEQSKILREFYRAENEAALEGTGIDVDDFFPAPAEGREARLPPKTLSSELLLRVVAGLAVDSKRQDKNDPQV